MSTESATPKKVTPKKDPQLAEVIAELQQIRKLIMLWTTIGLGVLVLATIVLVIATISGG